MINGGNYSTVVKRERLAAIMEASGRCPHCPPHRGENGYGRHVRWIDGKPVKRKGKAVK